MAPPKTVFATPTTNLSIADLASCTYRAAQCVGVAVNAARLSEPTSPEAPVVIPIRVTTQTSADAQDLVCDFWQTLGYLAVVELDAAEPQFMR